MQLLTFERLALNLTLSILTYRVAVSTGTPVFVKTGEDLFLDVKKNVTITKGSDFAWKFNGHRNVVKYNGGQPYHFDERAVFSVQTFSLLLKNAQKNDSGDYFAYYSGDKDNVLAKYQVTVQDPVSAVELTVESETDSCNLSVTCRTQDSHINVTVRCVDRTCIQEGGGPPNVTTTGASLHIYLQNGKIICNYSNQVSWERNYKKDFCLQNVDSEPGTKTTIIGPVIACISLPIICIVVYLIRKTRNRKSNCAF
uniref:Immunoglobulin subtype domain-containing protein n=1 Tax=Mola mola TaxID=94237 RepID=A0A3Q4BXV9_MOLML